LCRSDSFKCYLPRNVVGKVKLVEELDESDEVGQGSEVKRGLISDIDERIVRKRC